MPTVFYAAAGLFVLFKAWHGWRLGVVRQGWGILAAAVAWVVAFFGSEFIGGILASLGVPDFFTGVAGGLAVAALLYVVILLVGAVLFKKTADQSVTLVRLAFGAGGACLGMLVALVLVWAALVGLRVAGGVAEADLFLASHVPERSKEAPPAGWVQALAGLKRSVEEGPAGALVERLDPMPLSFEAVLRKLPKIAVKEGAMARFAAYPEFKAFLEQPKVAALARDPQISECVARRDFLALLRTPAVLAVLTDPEIGRQFEELPWQKALDHALDDPAPRRRERAGE